MAKNKGWRPSDKEEKLPKLVIALQEWQSRDSAMAICEVSKTTFYRWMSEDESFGTKIEQAEDFWMSVVHSQKKKLVDSWYRPAIEKELKSKNRKVYGDKHELTGADGWPIDQTIQIERVR